MISRNAILSPKVCLRAFFAALAFVSLIAVCAPGAKADVIYSYVGSGQTAGTTFTIDSPVFLTPSSSTSVTVTTSSDLFFFGQDLGKLLSVTFDSPYMGAHTYGSQTGLYFPFSSSSVNYNLGADGVYNDGLGDILTVTGSPTPPPPPILPPPGDVLYSYVGSSFGQTAGTSFTILSSGFLSPSSTVAVTTSSDLFFYGQDLGKLLFVTFDSPYMGAHTAGSQTGLYFPFYSSSVNYNLAADGVYNDGVGDIFTVISGPPAASPVPEPDTVVLWLTGLAAGTVPAIRRRLAIRR